MEVSSWENHLFRLGPFFHSYIKSPEGTRINQPFGNSITNIGDLMGFYNIYVPLLPHKLHWWIGGSTGSSPEIPGATGRFQR